MHLCCASITSGTWWHMHRASRAPAPCDERAYCTHHAAAQARGASVGSTLASKTTNAYDTPARARNASRTERSTGVRTDGQTNLQSGDSRQSVVYPKELQEVQDPRRREELARSTKVLKEAVI